MLNKPAKIFDLSTRITLVSSCLFAAILAAIFFYTTNQFEQQGLDNVYKRTKFISDFISKKIEKNIDPKDSKENDEIFNEIIEENGVRFVVLSNRAGTYFKTFNLKEAEKNFYIVPGPGWDNNMVYKTSRTIQFKNKEKGDIFVGFSTRGYNTQLTKTNFIFGFLLLGVFILGTLLLFFLNYYITKPLKRITDSAVKVSNGNLKHRIKIKSNNQLGLLAHTFNTVATELEKAYSRLEKMNHEMKFHYKERLGELSLEINQRRTVENSLKQSEEYFRLLFELAPIGMIQTSIDGRILKVNNAFCNSLGYDHDEILNTNSSEITHPKDKNVDKAFHDNLLYGKQMPSFEKRLIRKDKGVIYTIFKSSVVCDEKGKPLHFISQFIDITDRKKMEEDLVDAKEKAEQSDRLKSAFLAQMSHEIRTPLNVILTATPLLADDIGGDEPEETKCILDSVSSAGKRLQRTIDLILNMSSVQSGNYEPDFQMINLGNELKLLTEEFNGLSAEKNLKLVFNNTAHDARIYADCYTINQVFQNIIGNAVKYTLKGKVEINILDGDQDKLFVEVKDTGIGMSADFMSKLFSPFSQEDVGQKREFEGNGLGLALVKKYLEINNADIAVESEKNKGSVFKLTFNRFLESRTSAENSVKKIMQS